MICALLLSLIVAAPQEPRSEGLQAHLRSLKLETHAAGLAERLAPVERPVIEDPGFPGLARALRREKQPIVDPLLEALALPTAESLGTRHVQRLAETLVGAPAARAGPERRTDLSRFEQVLDDEFNKLNSALGGRQNYQDLWPELQAATDQLRDTTDPAQLSRSDLEMMTRRLRRMEKIDQAELVRVANRVLQEALALKDDRLLEHLARQDTRKPRQSVEGEVLGDVLIDKDSGFGRLVVGGFGRNVYDCRQVDVIIDLGGDDEYRGPAGGTTQFRRMGIVIDLSGNDTYDSLNDSLGSATYGLGMLVDFEGDEKYEARARSCGFGLAGIGVFLDGGGKDVYTLEYFCAGVGLGGIGVFADMDGDDEQKAASQSFGLGLPGGVGLFVDAAGDDRRQVASMQVKDDRGEADFSMSMGVGVGLDKVLAGGVGLFVDGGGNDVYHASGLALGAGAQTGLGIFVDLSGNDHFVGGTGVMGAAYRHGMALFVDVAGDDHYEAGGMALGAAAHFGQAFLVDMAGDDRYHVEAMGLGTADAPGMAGLLDLDGKDEYVLLQGETPWGARGKSNPDAGALSLFLDAGEGEDEIRWEAGRAPVAGEVKRWEERPGEHPVVTVRANRYR